METGKSEEGRRIILDSVEFEAHSVRIVLP